MPNCLEEFNERGIRCLENREYNEAASNFNQGLRLVKLRLATTTQGFDNEFDAASTCIGCCSATTAKEGCSENGTTRLVPSQGTTGTLYENPFYIASSLHRCACMACHSKVAFVFIFNAALSFHLGGLTPEKNSRRLQKASRLYIMARNLSQQGTFPVLQTEDLALRQNLAQIQQTQALAEDGPVLLLASSYSPDISQEEIVQAVWYGFLSVVLNLCVFSSEQTAPAAWAFARVVGRKVPPQNGYQWLPSRDYATRNVLSS